MNVPGVLQAFLEQPWITLSHGSLASPFISFPRPWVWPGHELSFALVARKVTLGSESWPGTFQVSLGS